MYVNRGVSSVGLGEGWLDFLNPVGAAVGDWARKSMGLPTEAEERAKEAAQAVEAQKQLGMTNIVAQAGIQKYLIVGGLAVAGLTAFLLLKRK